MVGDSLLQSAFMCISGVMSAEHRDDYMQDQLKGLLSQCGISTVAGGNILKVFDNARISEWCSRSGLSADLASQQAATLIDVSFAPPLVIDPQAQASDFISKQHESSGVDLV